MKRIRSQFVIGSLLVAVGMAAGQQPASTPPPAATAPAQSTPTQDQNRDLKFKKETTLPPGQVTVKIPRSYALVIGISKYENLPPEAQLEYPDRDAESVYTVLISAEGGQFPAENVHKLINENATAANIKKELETWLPSVTKDDDRVVIYFAGHGFVSSGRGLSRALRHRPEEHSRHLVSDGRAGHGHRRKDQRQVEGADHRLLPFGRHHPGGRSRQGQPDFARPAEVAVLASPPAATASRASRARSGVAGMASSLTTWSKGWRARPTRTATAWSPPMNWRSMCIPMCAWRPTPRRTRPRSGAASIPTWCWPTIPGM